VGSQPPVKWILDEYFFFLFGQGFDLVRQFSKGFDKSGREIELHCYHRKSFKERSFFQPLGKLALDLRSSSTNSLALNRCLKYSLVLANLPLFTSFSTLFAI